MFWQRGLIGGLFCWAALLAASATDRLCAQPFDLVPLGAEYAYFKGTEEPSPDIDGLPTTDWTRPEFAAAGWARGNAGFGYGDRAGAIGTPLNDMEDLYASVYLRHVFTIDDLAAVSAVRFNADYDDGFVAYLNGVEVARAGLNGTPPAYTTLSTSHESRGALTPFDIADFDMLVAGENMLAIQLHNTSLGSSDCVMVPQLVANPLFCPSDLSCVFDTTSGTVRLDWENARAEYDSIAVHRDGAVLVADIGGDAESWEDDAPPIGDVTYEIAAVDGQNVDNADCPVLSCTVTVLDLEALLITPGAPWLYFKGLEAPAVGWTSLDFDDTDWLEGPTGIGYGAGDDATVLSDMRNSYVSIFTRKVLLVERPEEISVLRLDLTIDDGCVVWLNGREVGRINMPIGPVDHLTEAVSAIAEDQVRSIELDPSMLAEENILAISVHNTTIGSSDLSFIPALYHERGGGEALFRRGDVDNNGAVNLTDAVRLLDHLFRQQPPPDCADAADVDDNGALNLTDSVRLLGHLFRAEPPPPEPGLDCGVDPTADPFADCSTTGC